MRVRISWWQLLLMVVAIKLSQLATYSPNLIGRLPPARDAWMAVLIAPLPVAIIVLIVYNLSLRFPRLDVYQYAARILGRPAGTVFNLVLVLLFVHWLGISYRQFAEFFSGTMYGRTPLIVFTLMAAAAVWYTVVQGMEVIARGSEISGVFVILGVTMLLVVLVPEYRLNELLPLLAEGMGPVLEHASLTALIFGEAIWVALLGVPLLYNMRSAPKALFGSLALGTVIVSLLTAAMLVTLGPEIIARAAFPTYQAARLVNIGNFLQRGEWILVPLWMASMFVKLSVLTYGASLGFRRLTGSQSVHVPVFVASAAGVAWAHVYLRDLAHLLALYVPSTYVLHAAPIQLAPVLLFVVAWLRGLGLYQPDTGDPGEEERPHGT